MRASEGVGLNTKPVLDAASNFNRAGAKISDVARLSDEMYAGGEANQASFDLWQGLRRCLRETYEGYFMLQKGIHDTVHDLLTTDGEVAGGVSHAEPVFKPGSHDAGGHHDDRGDGRTGNGPGGRPDLPGVGSNGPEIFKTFIGPDGSLQMPPFTAHQP